MVKMLLQAYNQNKVKKSGANNLLSSLSFYSFPTNFKPILGVLHPTNAYSVPAASGKPRSRSPAPGSAEDAPKSASATGCRRTR
jgi:hypothetical protein